MKPAKLLSKKVWQSVALILLLAPLFIFSEIALAQGGFDFGRDSGLVQTGDEAGFATSANAATLDSLIARIIFVGLGLVGVLFLSLTLLNGFNWMIAQGNEDKINKAKDGLINSIVGLIITLASYAISYFLLSYFT